MRKQIIKIGFFTMLFLGVGLQGYAQKVAEKKAEKEYDNLAYIDAIKIYERIANKGYTNASMLEKLADANYFNGRLVQANKWYSELFEGEYSDKGQKIISSEYYYRYAQTLKAVENYDKANQIMQQFVALEKDDSRAKLFEENKGYLQQIENKDDRYDLKAIDINSEYSDYGATLLGNQLVYTSARQTDKQATNQIHEWTNESFTSLFSSKINEDGTFSEPVLFSKELDSRVNDATAVFTKDGKTMYFTRNNSKQSGKKKYNKEHSSLLKIYKATLSESGKWENTVELSFNSDDFNTAHPALSPDEKWLYFASDRKGTRGESDIFRVEIYENGEFGRPENLGEKVNTSGRETFPFISNDNLLFFSSDGHPGLGGLDVFVTKINVDGTFGTITNMGTPINSSFDDFAFYINGKSTKGFVSSNRTNGLGGDDIYFFSEKACKQAVEGVVFDKNTKEVLANSLVIISDALYQTSDTLYTDSKGYYKKEALECGQKYRIKGEKELYSTVEISFTVDYKSAVKTVDIGLDKTEEPIAVNDDLFKKLKLEPIYFDFDKSNIRQDASIELIKIVEVMKEYPTMKIDVRSHTDSRGKDSYNLKLSDRRAKSTIQWIISQGIDANRVIGKGYGETQLLNNCSNGVPCSAEEHQLNRRSEFIVLEL